LAWFISISEAGKWGALIDQTWVLHPPLLPGLELAPSRLYSLGQGRSGFSKKGQGGVLWKRLWGS
jgi:hypothetical protein